MSGKLHRILVALLLAWVGLAGLFLAWHDSLTTDEDVHMASGYTILTRHDFRFDPEHPPLFKMLSAAPLLLLRLNPPPDDKTLWQTAAPTFFDSWKQARSWGDEWTYISGNPADTIKVLARIPSVLTLIGLCWVLYWLSREWFGPRVALWTLFFAAFNPTLLAHGHLANDDVAVTFAIVGAIALLWRYLQRPGPLSAVWLGLATAAAICTKFTGIGLLPIIVIIFACWGIKGHHGRRPWLDGLLTMLVVWAGIWLCYGFQSPLDLTPASITLAERAWHIPHNFSVPELERWARIARYVLPMPFIKGFIIVQNSTLNGRGTYLLGNYYWPGIWYYFPVVLALKTQLVALALLLVGLLLAVRSRWRVLLQEHYALLSVSLAVFVALSIYNKLDIGIRHIAPVIALLMPLLGLTMERLAGIRWSRYLAYGTIVAYALPVFIQLPSMLSYANLLVQPYSDTWRYFNDSNVDWGQQAQAAAELVRTDFNNQTVAVNYMWNPYQLQYYGMHTVSFNPQVPPTDTLIMVTADQLSQAAYSRFRTETPVARISNSTFFFRLPS